jgi:peptidoglycan/LPS O-acetylase OafA/YrhL
MKINHKPDNYFAHIDGLRAIAVMSVVLHHLMPSFVPGGFIGVDVFFVISGYLITGILIREMEAKNFSFMGFYERRARRIFPALFAVLLFTLIGSYILFLPSDFISTLRGAFGTVFFISNMVFWQDLSAGYFAAMDGALNPLVHTWSLAVEEQFYVLFPILLLLCYKIKFHNFLVIFSLLFLISLLSSEYFIDSNSVAVFFLSPFRAWELLAGSILALKIIPNIDSKLGREFFSGMGLAAILYACFYLNDHTSFPGISALLPVLGSVAIIHSGMGGDGVILRILKLKPFIFIGLISYSLYLWHWPLIVFANYLNPAESFSIFKILFLLIASISLSTISYYLVEQPFRAKRTFSRKVIFSSSITVMMLFSAFAVLGIKTDGFQSRFTPEVIAFDKARAPQHIWKSCDSIMKSEDWCIIGDKQSTKEILLFGDSHLMSWAPALDDALKKTGRKGYLAMQSNCPPILNLEQWQRNRSCSIKNQSVKDFIASNQNLDHVIISGYWPAYFGDLDSTLLITNLSANEKYGLVHQGLLKSIDWLLESEKIVTIIGPVPVYDESVPMLLGHGLLFGNDYLQSNYVAQQKQGGSFPEIISNYSQVKNFFYLDPLKWMCNPECITTIKGESMYFDSNHLNVMGAKFYEDNFRKELSEIFEIK